MGVVKFPSIEWRRAGFMALSILVGALLFRLQSAFWQVYALCFVLARLRSLYASHDAQNRHAITSTTKHVLLMHGA